MSDCQVILHAHFYQPPRENGWTEEIELQESAAPFHDWNERIAAECYRPNSCARVVGQRGAILNIVNNYAWISFNFGPTLIDWIKKKDRLLYGRILEADKASRTRWGFGNGIAQAYNHMILPLANQRDKETQIYWGRMNFQHHFGRDSLGMWMPETAVDAPTVRELIRQGVHFIILSPHQAEAVRPIGADPWLPVSPVELDISQPYRVYAEDSDRTDASPHIDVFFYHGGLAHNISFGDLLGDGQRFCRAVRDTSLHCARGGRLVHVATDGEVYGHHRKFADLTLAYAVHGGFAENGLELTNYAAYLHRHPPTMEVKIHPGDKGRGSSWSCAHGVSRWYEDCGCHTGGKPGWNQKWRTPLRQALDSLRDDLALLFEREGSRLFHDPWHARNEYIHLLMNPSREHREQFFARQSAMPLGLSERSTVLKLLEMQRHAMLMYTSCAWFFSDVSGIETIQVLQYARRALELAHQVSGTDPEPAFLQQLSEARSNIREQREAKTVYLRYVRPAEVTPERVAHHVSVASLVPGDDRRGNAFGRYRVDLEDYDRRSTAGAVAVLGRMKVMSETTEEEMRLAFASAYFGGYRLRTSVIPDVGPDEFRRWVKKIFYAFDRRPENILAILDARFNNHSFSFDHLMKDPRRDFIRRMVEESLNEYETSCENFIRNVDRSALAMSKEGMPLPDSVQSAAGVALSRRLNRCVDQLRKTPDDAVTMGELRSVYHKARSYNCAIDTRSANARLSALVEESVERCVEAPSVRECTLLLGILKLASDLGFQPDLTEAQNRFFSLLRNYVQAPSSNGPFGAIKDPLLTASLMQLASGLGFEIGADSFEG